MGFILYHSIRNRVGAFIMDKEFIENERMKRYALELIGFCKKRDNCIDCPFASQNERWCLIEDPAIWDYAMGI